LQGLQSISRHAVQLAELQTHALIASDHIRLDNDAHVFLKFKWFNRPVGSLAGA
jgi:hypothetical protein